jgi:hypothetical protein
MRKRRYFIDHPEKLTLPWIGYGDSTDSSLIVLPQTSEPYYFLLPASVTPSV